jgi:pimeloyl-ACP methyl ester carboxylesterase
MNGDTTRTQIVSEEVSFVAGGWPSPAPSSILSRAPAPGSCSWRAADRPIAIGTVPCYPARTAAGDFWPKRCRARRDRSSIDKAFSGKNPGLPIADLTLDTYRDEASAALDFLRSRAEVDPARVFVAGHSEGGIHATRLAQSAGDRIRGVILISAPGRSLRRCSKCSSSERPGWCRVDARGAKGGDGANPDRAAPVAGQTSIRSRHRPPADRRRLDRLDGATGRPIGRALQRSSGPGGGGNRRTGAGIAGRKDIQVDPAEDAERLLAARRSARKAVEYHLSPSADHVLKTEPRSLEEVRATPQLVQTGYNAPTGFSPPTSSALAQWIATTEPG